MKEFFPGMSLADRKATTPGISWNEEAHKKLQTCTQPNLNYLIEPYIF
jgi:hypothetical protein